MDMDSVEIDLLVIGSGVGGMAAALAGAVLGMNVIVVEKTDKIGGTSARSAGSVWLPNTRHSSDGEDNFELALTYLRNAIESLLDEEKIAVFLHAAPKMVDLFEDKTSVKLRAYPYHPDYLATLKGATLSGRVLEPVPFDASVLGHEFHNLRSPLPEFMLLGGMMVDRTDIGHLMSAWRNPSSLWHTLRLLYRYGRDRLRHTRGTRLVMGNALVGRLYYSLLQNRVPVWLSTETHSLTQSSDRISGAILNCSGKRIEVRTKVGVILATGGVSHHPTLRKSLMPPSLSDASSVVDSATGDGLSLAESVGGHLCVEHVSNSFWAPVSKRQRSDGSTAVFPHFVLDRGKPGALAVNPTGKRFVNEATTYHLFGRAIFETLENFSGRSCYLLCDDDFIEKYGLGMVRPKRLGLSAAVQDGYVVKAGTLEGLADKIDLPKDALVATVARHNSFALTGIDADFGKGKDVYQRNLGDPSYCPNPCLGKLTCPPFYALEILPGDIGTSAGLKTNASAQVLGVNDNPISGLYACGNDLESIVSGYYPGPGITLGPAMTFGYIAAQHAFGILKNQKSKKQGT